MIGRHFTLFVLLLAMVSAGCSNSPPPKERTPIQFNNAGNPDVPNSHVVNADIRITDSAKNEITAISRQARGAMVRLEFTPEGCTGIKTHLFIEFDPPTANDSYQVCGDLNCVFLTEQFPLVQGALIDFVQQGNVRGFAITHPNKTRENLAKTTKWINDAAEKRAKKWDEDQRLQGNLAERIVLFRKLAADDPMNELGHYRLAQLLMQDGKTAEAAHSFERTLELSPDFSKASQLLGECLIKLDQKQQAIGVLSKGWTTADRRGDDGPREAMGQMLMSIGATIPTSRK